jgi:hypothetical protein
MQFGLRWFATTHVPARKLRITSHATVIDRIFAARTIVTFLSVEWTPSRPKEYVRCYERP